VGQKLATCGGAEARYSLAGGQVVSHPFHKEREMDGTRTDIKRRQPQWDTQPIDTNAAN